MPRPTIGYRLLEAVTSAYQAIDRLGFRVMNAGGLAVGGFLAHAMSVDELSRLGVRLYEQGHRVYEPDKGLWEWEEPWFSRQLPRPPARVLVGAAGWGREAVALAARGYTIDAFEPVAAGASRCAAELSRTGGPHRVVCARYEDLAAAVLDAAPTPCAPFARETYDAMLFGWGSASHLLDREARLRALTAAASLVPRGPLLVSFYMATTRSHRHERSRAGQVGVALGRRVGALRGAAGLEEDYEFSSGVGFAHPYSHDEIEQLGAVLGRRVVWEPEGAYAHVTLLPPAAAG